MKQNHFDSSRLVRNFALSAGVLTVAFAAVPPAARAGEFRAPHEILHRFHEQVRDHVLRIVDHGSRFNDNHRRDFGQRYPRQSYPRYYRPSYRPSYRYPVVVGGGGFYRRDGACSSRRYVSGYVGVPGVGVVIRSGRPRYESNCDRDDRCGRDGYRDDDRRRQDDDYDNDRDSDRDSGDGY